MAQTTFDIETMINSLSIFDQAALVSASNLKENFDTALNGILETATQVAANIALPFQATAFLIDSSFLTTSQMISAYFMESSLAATETFNTAFLAIGETAMATSLVMADAFLLSLAAINASLLATQLTSDLVFGLLSVNAANFFMMAVGAIISQLAVLNTAITASCLAMELSFAVSFVNVISLFILNITTMVVALAAGLELMKIASIVTAGEISAGILGFSLLIIENIATTECEITKSLDSIKETAETTTDESTTGFTKLRDMVSFTNGVISLGKDGLNLYKKVTGTAKEAQAGLTQILNINTGVQATNTTATAAAGATASAASLSFLAFGGGVLALGAGLLLAATAFALMAKVAFNALKLLGKNTHGVEASDFDLSFKVDGLATGGFPSMGQMFIAREAGPELVGTIGSHNAVVNNDQIVESVSSGVYRAVRDALSGQSSGSSTLQLIMDGAKVAEIVAQNVNSITKRTGRCPIVV